jgi:hypothetical protein
MKGIWNAHKRHRKCIGKAHESHTKAHEMHPKAHERHMICQITTVIVTTYTKKGEKVKNINYMCILSTCIALSDSLVHVVVTRLVPAVNVSITAGVVLP